MADYGLEEIQNRVTRRLSGLKCAAFYGCYLLRGQTNLPYDDPYQPESMENVFRAIGATPIYYRGRTQCCGWPLSSYATNQAFQMAGTHVREAIDKGADCMVTSCPLCHLSLYFTCSSFVQAPSQSFIPLLFFDVRCSRYV